MIELMIEERARVFDALSDPTRLRIVELVRGRELANHEIAESLGISPALACHHLKQLAESGLLTPRRSGQSKLYRLNQPVLEQHCRSLIEGR
jgi:DNA-binding transcriptional ArsR family regulator